MVGVSVLALLPARTRTTEMQELCTWCYPAEARLAGRPKARMCPVQGTSRVLVLVRTEALLTKS